MGYIDLLRLPLVRLSLGQSAENGNLVLIARVGSIHKRNPVPNSRERKQAIDRDDQRYQKSSGDCLKYFRRDGPRDCENGRSDREEDGLQSVEPHERIGAERLYEQKERSARRAKCVAEGCSDIRRESRTRPCRLCAIACFPILRRRDVGCCYHTGHSRASTLSAKCTDVRHNCATIRTR